MPSRGGSGSGGSGGAADFRDDEALVVGFWGAACSFASFLGGLAGAAGGTGGTIGWKVAVVWKGDFGWGGG